MAEPDLAKIRNKIRLLLNLAGNNPNEFEAASAAAKAAELMTQYNISLDETQDINPENVVKVEHDRFELSNYWFGIESLASGCARAFYCRLILHRPHVEGKTGAVSFIGREANRMAAQETFNWLAQVAINAEVFEWDRWAKTKMLLSSDPELRLAAERNGIKAPTRPSHKHNFYLGFGEAIKKRLVDWQIELAKQENVKSVTVHTERENEDYLNQTWPNLGKARMITANNDQLFGRGYAVGQLTSLNRTRELQ